MTVEKQPVLEEEPSSRINSFIIACTNELVKRMPQFICHGDNQTNSQTGSHRSREAYTRVCCDFKALEKIRKGDAEVLAAMRKELAATREKLQVADWRIKQRELTIKEQQSEIKYKDKLYANEREEKRLLMHEINWLRNKIHKCSNCRVVSRGAGSSTTSELRQKVTQ